MTTHLRICWICVTISSLWLIMSVLVAWHIVALEVLEIPIALLMGGSVLGISYQRQTLKWKILTITIGMPMAYVLITNLTRTTVIIELVLLLVIAYELFVRKIDSTQSDSTRELEEKMKQCC